MHTTVKSLVRLIWRIGSRGGVDLSAQDHFSRMSMCKCIMWTFLLGFKLLEFSFG